MYIAHLSLGSNLGDRLTHLQEALKRLTRQGHVLRQCSSVYETDPLETPDQPEFLNLAIEIDSTLPPADILQDCLRIETEMGRVRTSRFGPRPIDIDLLLVGDTTVQSEELTLPHPRMHLRRFVLVPLCEIAPEVLHPVMGVTVRELLSSTPDGSRVEKYCGSLI